ncbi:hypothetical protein CSC2_21620 [Clostridium zeae]|uniref:KAP NTPase domain-containing protein n=1 Tax=Clostridium zeae TaxID=2759022 RepID=A0ABQ1EA37_9CLOT|nr:P-loop NTPase fold protein [Clostridium zeae]GFZ31636.1 hypothetical protein CSC2_21620 [Clostridium zeae]
MGNKFYNNRDHRLNNSSDLFGTYFKANAILKVLDNLGKCIEVNNMIALYGAWGSGKTSTINYIYDNVTTLEPVIFQAWKYEKDLNLALSLFELISDKIKNDLISSGRNPLIDGLAEKTKIIAGTMFSFAKNTLLNSEINVLGIKLAIGKAGQEAIKEMEELKLDSEKSYFDSVEEFNNSFNELIDKYFETTGKRLLIFVDDLDRCEPDKVIDLLATIKHFFTNTKNAVYFCAIDKTAVSESIKLRYSNVIEAEEYLEKIFDITFNMPDSYDLQPVINDFFNRIGVDYTKVRNLDGFLEHIEFTNPRKIKKVFNKYIMLLELAEIYNSSDNEKLKFLELKRTDEMFIIVFIYFIILFEFHRTIYSKLSRFRDKFVSILNNLDETFSIETTKGSYEKAQYLEQQSGNIYYPSLSGDITKHIITDEKVQIELINFIILFMPTDVQIDLPNLDIDSTYQLNEVLFSFYNSLKKSDQKILTSFIEFILDTTITKGRYEGYSVSISQIIHVLQLLC